MNQHNHEWTETNGVGFGTKTDAASAGCVAGTAANGNASMSMNFWGAQGSRRKEKKPTTIVSRGVSGPAIPTGSSHVHRIVTLTDNTDHFHRIEDTTGEAIPVGEGRHVHFVRGETSFDDGHRHEFIFATLIENPTGEDG